LRHEKNECGEKKNPKGETKEGHVVGEQAQPRNTQLGGDESLPTKKTFGFWVGLHFIKLKKKR